MVAIANDNTFFNNIVKAGQNVVNKISTNKTVPKKSGFNGTIGAATLKAQQALSEKLGIPTFNLQGQVNTLPQTRPLDTRINVGTGSSGLMSNTFNDLISRFTPQSFTVQSREVFTPGLGGLTVQPVSSTLAPGEIVVPSTPTGSSFIDSARKGFSDLTKSIGPIGLLIGAVVLGVVLLKR